MNTPNLKYALLAELLRTLEAEGFAFGIDKHLQLQTLLEKLPEDISAEQLKQSLAPAIATNEQEQTFFYLLFDQALKRVEAVQAQNLSTPPQPTRGDNWIIPAISFLTLLLIPLLWMLLFPPPNFSKSIDKEFAAYLDSTYTICLDEISLQELKLPIQTAYFCENGSRSDSSLVGQYELTDEFCLAYTAGDTILAEAKICTRFIDSNADTLTVYFEPQLSAPPSVEHDSIPEEDPVAQAAIFDYQDYPVRTDIYDLKIPELGYWQQVYNRHYKKLKILFALLATLLTALILLHRQRKRRKLVAEVERHNNPPFVWNIETEETPLIEVGNNFDTLLNGLRKRAESDHRVFDAPKTINATIERAGMIDFQYSAQTRPPEYLLLLDRESGDSHRTRFFDYLQQRFLENEVFIHRYFYDNDLRRVWNEQHSNGLNLKELGRLHPEARLIIIGNAYQLLSPLSGKLAKWAKIVAQWKERAILSYIPSAQWGRRERQLGKEFVVLPASPDSLRFLVDQWDQGEEAEFEKWRDVVKDAPAEPITWEGDLMNTLAQHYSPSMLRWIAACAVYPALHWDATLFIGEQIATPEAPLLSLEKLHQLNRLEWFRQGEIPKEARATLLDWLEANHPESLQQARTSLFELLEQNPPPKESAAFEDYQLNRDLNEWLITTNRGRKRELEEAITEQIDGGAEPDFTVIKYLERERTPLDFIVPNAFKKYVYNSGFKGLGLRRMQYDLLWALPILGVILFMAFLWSPRIMPCEGKKVVFLAESSKKLRAEQGSMLDIIERVVGKNNVRPDEELLQEVGNQIDTTRYNAILAFFQQKDSTYHEELELCIKNTADSILYAEYANRLFIASALIPEANAQTQAVEAMYQATPHTPLLDSAYVAYHKNTAVAYYDKAVDWQFKQNPEADPQLLQQREELENELNANKEDLEARNRRNRTDKAVRRQNERLEEKIQALEDELEVLNEEIAQNKGNFNLESVKDSMCFYFNAAHNLDSNNVEIKYAYDWCQRETLKAEFRVKNNNCEAPCRIEFQNLSTGANRYKWYIDSKIIDGNINSYDYGTAGTYRVTLDAYDINDAVSSYTQEVKIRKKRVVVSPPNTNQGDNNSIPDYRLTWQYPQVKRDTVSEAKQTIAIDIKSNTPLTTTNLVLYQHGNTVPLNELDLKGSTPRQTGQERSYSYTFRKEIILQHEDADNALQLVVQDKDGKEIAKSAEHIFVLKRADTNLNNPPPPFTNSNYMWCLDNQHGKDTRGKRSPMFEFNGEATQFFEYEFDRDIVSRVELLLKQNGIATYRVTPETNDISLKQRAARVNNLESYLPKRLLIISSNAGPPNAKSEWTKANGIETYYYADSYEGRELATIFQNKLINVTGWNNRGIKPNSNIYGLKNSKSPALLLELGFFNNEAQVQELMKDSVRQQLAQAIVDAILEVERAASTDPTQQKRY